MLRSIKYKLYEVYDKFKTFLSDFFEEEHEEIEEKGKESKAEYLVPLDERTIKYLPKWAQEEIASWRAKARALEEKIEELKEELDKYKKLYQAEELREIARLKKALEESALYNNFYVVLKTEKDIVPLSWDGKTIIVRVRSKDEEFPVQLIKIVGIIIGDSEYGPTAQLVCMGRALRPPYEEHLMKIDLGLLEQLPYTIYDFKNLLQHLQRGVLILNIDSAGRRVPYALTVRVPPQSQSSESNNPNNQESDNQKYIVLEEYRDLLNQYPDLKDLILDLYDRVNRLTSENADLKAQLEEWKDKYSEVYAELNALKKHIETNRAMTLKAMTELGESYKAIADTVGTNLQLSMRLQSLEAGFFDLVDRHEDLVRKYIHKTTMLPEEAGELVADKVADKLKEKIPLDIIERGIRMVEERKAKTKSEEPTTLEE